MKPPPAVQAKRWSASIAGSPSRITQTGIENTAPIHVTSPPATEVTSMSEEQFDRELKFQVSMALVDEMLEKGIIGQEDYEKWLRHMTQKYNPPIGRVVSKKSS
jgi:hypothetical protein